MTMTWDDLEPRIAALLDAELDADGVAAWLRERDAFERDYGEAMAGLYRAKDEDTNDAAAQEAYLTFVRTVLAPSRAADHELDQKLHGVAGYEPPEDLRVAWLDLADRMAVFDLANIKLEVEADELLQRYGQLNGSVRVELDGETITVTEARAKLIEPDRALRERAWRAIEAALEGIRGELDDIFLQLVRLRARMAEHAGFSDFRAMVWRERHRREYGPDDARTFHASVAAEVVPNQRLLMARRGELLGIDTVRPWDTAVDPYGEEPLRPFVDVAQLETGLQRMFDTVDPQLGAWFARLRDGWMDLEPRPNKIPGLGYQLYFPRSRTPYIHWSAVGIDQDLVVLRHEAGHAFHAMATAERWPLLLQHADRPELTEFASHAMELLTLPYLASDRGGFYTPEQATRSRRAQLERILNLWSSTSVGDAIQHWIYTQDAESLTAEAIDAAWLEIAGDFDAGVDWSGLERSRSKGWHIFHLFQLPFYFLEYGLSFLGAVQVWRHARHDHAAALAAYKRALSLGGTAPLDQAFAAAGARFAFDRDTVRELTAFVMAAMDDDL